MSALGDTLRKNTGDSSRRAGIAMYQKAFAKAEEVCREVASGNLEARITEIEEFGELVGFLNSINDVLDLTDAFVRESGASLEYASQGKYYRPFLETGMLGDYRRGASLINKARNSMQKMEEDAASARTEVADELEQAVSSVVGNIAATAEEMNTAAKEMTDEATAAHQQSVSVASAAEQSNTSTQTVAASAEQLTASIQEISTQITSSAEATQRAVETVSEAKTSVALLKEAGEEVDKVSAFIQQIANQTKLLALNATIEAARAGDAGKGFAVVASEVKKLAEETDSATQDIKIQIEAIQRVSEETAVAVTTVVDQMQDLNQVSEAIGAAVEEQTAATSEISQNVLQAAEGSQEVSSKIVDISATLEKTGKNAQGVQASSENLNGQTQHLQQAVNRFLEQMRSA